MERRTAWDRVLAIFYPERCCCCGRVVPCGEVVCASCRAMLSLIEPPVCPVCGRGRANCSCGKHRRHTERSVAPFYYDGAAKTAVTRLKFQEKPAAAELFIISMAKTVRREYEGVSFDYIVPVPVSTGIRKTRGYNQSAILAQGLSKELRIPWRETLVKLWETVPQRELPAYRRSGNVLGVFEPDGRIPLQGAVLLLVDDVLTTGATLDECAKILKIYGAGEVYAVTATASYLSRKEK